MSQLRSAFISYAFIDGTPDATAVSKFLQQRGINTFLATHDASDSEDIPSRVIEAMNGNEAVIFVISHASCSSAWVGYELGHARSLQKPVFAYTQSKTQELPRYLNREDVTIISSLGTLTSFFACKNPEQPKQPPGQKHWLQRQLRMRKNR